MPVDNQMYDRLSHTWWDEKGFLNVLRSALNPPRFGYMREVMVEKMRLDPAGLRVLDVGSGGGLLAEEFAALGCQVTGVDPSQRSLEIARAHAREAGLEIEYVSGRGEELPFEDGSFDAVYCCDVLEHVDDVPRTLRESARVVRPGGVYMYDTLNRTLRSKLVMIKLFQEWDATRCMEPALHDWRMFIKPRELEAAARAAGLEPRERVGIAPGRSKPALIRLLRKRRRGELSYGEFGRALRMKVSRDQSSLYAGYAVKRG
jgi:2-polyprenyl-6-hydroxyphenyl methylase / 3-demethylubiquinone-9 3-methyltransferase